MPDFGSKSEVNKVAQGLPSDTVVVTGVVGGLEGFDLQFGPEQCLGK